MVMQNLFPLILAGIGLILSGVFLVKSLSKIARFMRISDFIAAFIIMAFATAIPELIIGVSSAIHKYPEISIGNIVGSGIVDITLIMGIFILLGRGIDLKSRKAGKEMYIILVSILIVIALFLIGKSFSRLDGVILIILFLLNLLWIIKRTKQQEEEINKEEIKEGKFLPLSIFLVSLFILLISSNYIVQNSEFLATEIGLSPLIIGLFILSIATNLPELVFGIDSIIMKHKSMSIGDQTGAVFTYITLILGIVAVIHPFTVSVIPFLISCSFLFVATFLFSIFLRSDKKLDIFEGISLIIIYIVFVVVQYLVRNL
jgi:cation:H+ antiporter